MLNKKFKFIFLIAVTAVSFLISNQVFAHVMSNSQGSESTGYIVGPGHPATKSFTFANQNAASSNLSAARVGSSRWSATGIMTIKETSVSNTKNHIYEYSDKNSGSIAYTCYWYNPNTKINTRFSMYFNNYYMSTYTTARKNQIATHEWGHAFGLKDLYNASNKAKIMYGYGNTMTATIPTAKDKEGAIIGTR